MILNAEKSILNDFLIIKIILNDFKWWKNW